MFRTLGFICGYGTRALFSFSSVAITRTSAGSQRTISRYVPIPFVLLDDSKKSALKSSSCYYMSTESSKTSSKEDEGFAVVVRWSQPHERRVQRSQSPSKPRRTTILSVSMALLASIRITSQIQQRSCYRISGSAVVVYLSQPDGLTTTTTTTRSTPSCAEFPAILEYISFLRIRSRTICHENAQLQRAASQ